MTSDENSILENLTDAIALSRSVKHKIYVFFDGQNWGYSGKLPPEANRYYVAYPNGKLDQSNCPEIFPTSLEPNDAVEVIVKHENKVLKFMNGIKKYFIGYCAFSPYIALIFCLLFFHRTNGDLQDFFKLAFTVCLFCVPLSATFALIALHRPKSSRIAAMASMMASDSHIIFYSGLWAAATISPNPNIMIGATMLSMLLAGIALLFLWDNDKPIDTD